ncbi:hypothetical protein EON83_21545 [bacterium]|nr:MAG: hypothetical protein EON83_21545 [bacterium]
MSTVQTFCVATASILLLPVFTSAADTNPIYLDGKRPISERVNDLIPRMTLDEKVSQITDDWGSAAIPRLKIPALLKTEGLHGQSYSNGATIFPHAIASAATWDLPLVNRVGQAVGQESKAAGIYQTWSPVLDVARDARWGRIEETFGEDPTLVARMGVAWINGFQSQGLIATPKHFAGHGAPEGGRDSNDIGLSERIMREIHLVPFRAAFEEANAGGVMAAYGTWNGVPDNASTDLLQGILRQEWGFKGMVVTDCDAIQHFISKHAISTNADGATKMALEAGVNVECGTVWRKNIAGAVKRGVVNETLVDNALRPVLETKFRLGLFENPGPARLNWEKIPAYDTPEHRALARQMATESMVLVKNQNKILPLAKNLKTIAVIGPNAAQVQLGDYSARPVEDQLVSVLDGIKSHVAQGTQVLYAPGFSWQNPNDKSGFDEAVNIAKQADVVVMVMGDSSSSSSNMSRIPDTTGENRDGATLTMPGAQSDLIKAVHATGKPVVLTVVNGKPFVFNWEAENIPAILITWYAGEEAGNATADLLFGDRNPSGKLPLTFPRNTGQLPLTYDYKTSGRSYDYYDQPFSPQFRFGYGLSYTNFKYSNLQFAPSPQNPAQVTVTVDVQNTGTVAGDEVAQLYLTDPVASVVTPIMQLKGFQRLSLNPGETKKATFQLTPYDLSLLDVNMKRIVEPGEFRVHIGGSSPEIPGTGNGGRAQGENQKASVGFKDPSQGISGQFNVATPYAARFVYTLTTPPKIQGGAEFMATMTVKNAGNLTDITQADLYEGSKIASRRFELKPGETKSYAFPLTMYKAGAATLSLTGSDQLVSRAITVAKSPARLRLGALKTQVDDDGVVSVSTTATDVGSEAYKGQLVLMVDGKATTSRALTIQPGETQNVELKYAAQRNGNLKVQLGNLTEQNIQVPGGIGMTWGDGLLLSLPFNEGTGATAKDLASGKTFDIKGTPRWDAQSLTISDGAFVPVGGINLANRSFTLATWLKINQLNNGQIGIFGGRAPMGAGQNESGSTLHAGIRDGKLQFGFFGRDVAGQAAVPTGRWVHLAYSYDSTINQGTLYIDGKQDTQKDQLPYMGALETIGTTPQMQGGQFALHDLAVVGGALNQANVNLLSEKGAQSLGAGTYQTEWRPLKGALSTLQAWADIPAGSRITATIEVADASGKALDSKTLPLVSGATSLPLTGMKPGAQVRVRLDLQAAKGATSPRVGSLILKGDGLDARWITPSQWKKGVAAGGVSVDAN